VRGRSTHHPVAARNDPRGRTGMCSAHAKENPACQRRDEPRDDAHVCGDVEKRAEAGARWRARGCRWRLRSRWIARKRAPTFPPIGSTF